MNLLSHLEEAKSVSLRSPGTGRSRNFRVGAAVFKGPVVLAARGNSYKTHPAVLKFSTYPYLHAEIASLVSAGLDKCNECDIIITRVLRDNKTLTMARPCPSCLSAMKFAGIRRAYYTDWNGTLQCLSL